MICVQRDQLGYCFVVLGETAERLGREHVGLFEHLDAILSRK